MFDDAATFSTQRSKLDAGGYNFSSYFAEVISCSDVVESSIMITALNPAPRGAIGSDGVNMKVNGDWFASQPALAYWQLAEATRAGQTEDIEAGAPLIVRLLGITGDDDACQQLSAREQLVIRMCEAKKKSTIKCPQRLLVIRDGAPYRADILQLASADAGDALSTQRQGEAYVEEESTGGFAHKLARVSVVKHATGESTLDCGSEDDSYASKEATASAGGGGLKRVIGHDGEFHYVLSTTQLSERLLDLEPLGIRSMDPSRQKSFGVNQIFTATPKEYRDKLFFQFTARGSRKDTDGNGVWDSTMQLFLMQKAEVFKDLEKFTRAMTGLAERDRLDLLTLAHFSWLEGGSAAIRFGLGKEESTADLRTQMRMCFEGFENFFCITCSTRFLGMTDGITSFLDCRRGDPCNGLPDAFFAYMCHWYLVDILSTLRTETRSPPDALLLGPDAVRSFIVSKFDELCEELVAASREGSQGRTVRDFYSNTYPHLVWWFPTETPTATSMQPRSGGKAASSSPGKKKRARRGNKNDATSAPVTKVPPMRFSGTDIDSEEEAESGRQTPGARVRIKTEPSANSALCLRNLQHQLDPIQNSECDAGVCEYQHVNLAQTTRAGIINAVAECKVGQRVKDKVLNAVKAAPPDKFLPQGRGQKRGAAAASK
jgi:hypothetical protein